MSPTLSSRRQVSPHTARKVRPVDGHASLEGPIVDTHIINIIVPVVVPKKFGGSPYYTSLLPL